MVEPARADLPTRLAYATGALPGCGGRIKAAPGDFRVEELPAYEPCGAGEHLYLWIEKSGVDTAQVATRLQQRLGVPTAAIGTAGRKDTEAITRQWFSVHTPADPDPATLCDPQWRVLAASRHGNKLRPGHLRGNRFELVVRDTDSAAPLAALLAHIARDGFPNYFGPQRLGSGGRNAAAGRRLLRSVAESRAESGAVPRPRTGRALNDARFAVNAYQAALFNALVERRLLALVRLGTLLEGDLAVLHRNGASFPVDAGALAEAQTRADDHELSPSAPLFGTHAPLAAGEPGRWERELLEREGLSPESFHIGSKRLSAKGERRAVRAFAHDLAWELLPDTAPAEGELSAQAAPKAARQALRIRVTLGPGIYATALLRELMKNDDLGPLPPPGESGAEPGTEGFPRAAL